MGNLADRMGVPIPDKRRDGPGWDPLVALPGWRGHVEVPVDDLPSPPVVGHDEEIGVRVPCTDGRRRIIPAPCASREATKKAVPT